MEQLKHECGVAMIRLLKPLEYYKKKYGTYLYGMNKLYLLMEKQHNRGQEGAGAGVIKMNAPAGHEYVFRERALGSNAIQEIFSNINMQIDKAHLNDKNAEWLTHMLRLLERFTWDTLDIRQLDVAVLATSILF